MEPFFHSHLVKEEKYSAINVMASNLIAGMISGIITTPMQIIGRKQVSEAHPKTHHASSAWQVMKQIWKENGAKGLIKGWQGNAGASVIAFGIINGIDFDKYAGLFLNLFAPTKKPTSSPTLFNSNPKPSTASAPRIEEMKEENDTKRNTLG